ncbi:MAG: sugar phosphate isomerase/epimerase [Thermofilaceae archaeon]|nr:sugar phosphate isomerase/epimerase [Thermofilaceae archaeon]
MSDKSSSAWSVWTSWLVEYSIEEALEIFYLNGFRHLELSVEHFNECLARSGETAYLDETESFKVRALALADRGPVDLSALAPVNFVHAHGPFSPFNLQSPLECVRAVEIVKQWIKWCRKLDVKVLVCHPFTVKGLSWSELEELNLRCFKELSTEARECGILLAVENMGWGYGSRVEHLLRIIEECDDVAACVDTGHANLNAYRGVVDKMVAELGGNVAATHLSDNDGSWDQHVFPGRGSIDWKSVFKAFEAIGYSKPLNFEIPGETRECPDPSRRMEHLSSMIDNLRSRYSR